MRTNSIIRNYLRRLWTRGGERRKNRGRFKIRVDFGPRGDKAGGKLGYLNFSAKFVKLNYSAKL